MVLLEDLISFEMGGFALDGLGDNSNEVADSVEMAETERFKEFYKLRIKVDNLKETYPDIEGNVVLERLHEDLKMMLSTMDILTKDDLQRAKLAYNSFLGHLNAPTRLDLEAGKRKVSVAQKKSWGVEDTNNDYLGKQKGYPKKYLAMLRADMDMIGEYGFVFNEDVSVKENVKNLQRELRRVGVEEGSLATTKELTGIDGLYGPKTRAALVGVDSVGKNVDTITENERVNLKIKFDELISVFSLLDLKDFKKEFGSSTLTSERADELITILRGKEQDYKRYEDMVDEYNLYVTGDKKTTGSFDENMLRDLKEKLGNVISNDNLIS